LLDFNNIILAQNSNKDCTFTELSKLIKSREICEILYNPSKTAALVNIDCGSAYYINFKTKKTHRIVDNWPSVFFSWHNDSIAEVVSSCGTGCSQSVIFVAPARVITCESHDFRIKEMSKDEPPLSSNRPLLIDHHKGIYVCYDAKGNIQIFPLSKSETIYPPEHHYAESAKIQYNQLVITYENELTGHKKTKRYPLKK
jgi:hypothetical protein